MSKALLEQNASILREIEAKGADLSQPLIVDFSQVFREFASAEAFGAQAKLQNFTVLIEAVGDGPESWDVTASKEMTPTCTNITDAEKALYALARQYGGRVDGWGFMHP